MHLSQKVLLTVLCVTFFVQNFACENDCAEKTTNSTVLSRTRRYLDFLKATRVFFRANIKQNIFTWGGIWANAQGFKASMNMLNDNKALRPFRRDTLEAMQQLLDLHGFDGQACLMKAFCVATLGPDGYSSNGILTKLMRHIFLGGFMWAVFENVYGNGNYFSIMKTPIK